MTRTLDYANLFDLRRGSLEFTERGLFIGVDLSGSGLGSSCFTLACSDFGLRSSCLKLASSIFISASSSFVLASSVLGSAFGSTQSGSDFGTAAVPPVSGCESSARGADSPRGPRRRASGASFSYILRPRARSASGSKSVHLLLPRISPSMLSGLELGNLRTSIPSQPSSFVDVHVLPLKSRFSSITL